MVLNAIRTIQQEVFNMFDYDKHIEDAGEPNAQEVPSLVPKRADRKL